MTLPLARRIAVSFPALRHRDFRLLWTASTISLLGDGIWFVAISWQTLALSNSATALAVVWLAFTLPHIAMLLFGGVLSDRLPRRRVLLGANVVSGIFVGAIAVLSLAGVLSLWKLLILVAGYGASEAVFGPAYGAIVPELVDREVLTQANSLNQLNRPLALRLAGVRDPRVLACWFLAPAMAQTRAAIVSIPIQLLRLPPSLRSTYAF